MAYGGFHGGRQIEINWLCMTTGEPARSGADLAAHAKASRLAAMRIVATLRDAGHVAYFAGGCVRDELLGLQPTDYDVATDATPVRIRQLFRRTNEVGAAFGVMLVAMDVEGSDPIVVEVATFRADGVYTDSRRPDSVRFSDAPSDAARRDFTINALFLDPLAPAEPSPMTAAGVRTGVGRTGGARTGGARTGKEAARIDGRVIDYVNGVDDLKLGVVRAVGDADQRLAEDHLRALRAVRFAARLGFAVEERTFDAIRRHACELRGVSRERIGEELGRMLAHSRRAPAAHLLERLTLDAPVLMEASRAPEQVVMGIQESLTLLQGLEPARARHGRSVSVALALAAWMLDRGSAWAGEKLSPIGGVRTRSQTPSHHTTREGHEKDGVIRREAPAGWSGWVRENVQRARQALCLSNADTLELSDVLTDVHRLVLEWDEMLLAQRKRFAARDSFPQALDLLGIAEPQRSERILKEYKDLESDGVGISPEPILTGDHLIAAGLRPGPRFKGILDEVYDRQLEGRVRSLDSALELARKLNV